MDLKEKLLNIGGSKIDHEAEWQNFKDPRVVNFLLECGREFSTEGLQCLPETPFPDDPYSFHPHDCHKNCVELCVRGGRQHTIVYGWALSKDGIWNCHSWCIKRTEPERVVETTSRRAAYFGFVVPDRVHVLSMWLVPSTLGDQLEQWKSESPQSNPERNSNPT